MKKLLHSRKFVANLSLTIISVLSLWFVSIGNQAYSMSMNNDYPFYNVFNIKLDHAPDAFYDVKPAFLYSPAISIATYQFNQMPHQALQLNLFLPLKQDVNHLLYSNAQILDKNGASFSGSLVMGYRFIAKEYTNRLYGIYGAFDRNKGMSGHYFNQFSGGTEFWDGRLFLGSNFYLPFGHTQQVDNSDNIVQEVAGGTTAQDTPVNYIKFSSATEEALKGVDVALGYNLWRGLYLYGGGFYFKKSSDSAIVGPNIRTNYTWYAKDNQRILGVFNRISLDSQVSYDHFRGTQWYGGIKITINLWNRQVSRGVKRHMVDSIHRRLNVYETHLSYSTSSFLKNANGHFMTVAHPNNANALEHDINDPEVNIIGINHTIRNVGALNISHDLVLTGGGYTFTDNGRQYTIALGHQGALQSSGHHNLIAIVSHSVDSNMSVTIENIMLSGVGPTNQAIIADQGGFSLLTVNHVNSDGGMAVTLDHHEAGNIIFTHNTFVLSPINKIGQNILSFTIANDSILNILKFNDNHIELTGKDSSIFSHNLVNIAAIQEGIINIDNFSGNVLKAGTIGQYNGVYNVASQGGRIAYHHFHNNTITLIGDTCMDIADFAIGEHSLININDFNANQMISTGQGSDGMRIIVENDGVVTFNHFENNSIHAEDMGILFDKDQSNGAMININSSQQTLSANNDISSIFGADNVNWGFS